MPQIIFLDESGDLGWTLSRPYRDGGSSRYITLAAASVDADRAHVLRRDIRKLYSWFGWNPKKEVKWAGMSRHQRECFAHLAAKTSEREPTVGYYAVTVLKARVQEHIKRDANKLYNYMVALSLGPHMASHQHVVFKPDPRSVKVESGNSLHDYLQTKLWFEHWSSTILNTKPEESSASECVQFADMLAGAIQGHFEDRVSAPFYTLRPYLNLTKLFFC